jgi:hypothetical protein
MLEVFLPSQQIRHWTFELTTHRSIVTIERVVSIFQNGVIGMVSNEIVLINQTQSHKKTQL